MGTMENKVRSYRRKIEAVYPGCAQECQNLGTVWDRTRNRNVDNFCQASVGLAGKAGPVI